MEFQVCTGSKSDTSGIIKFRIQQFEDNNIYAIWYLEFGEACWNLTNPDTHECKNVGEDPKKFPYLDHLFGWDEETHQKLQESLDNSN